MIVQTADGVALNLDIAGEGPEVVFQHGLCGDRNQTAQVVPAGYRRLTLECRGHGLSEARGPFSIAQFTSDLAGVIGARAVVGGISMGAAIALRLAVTRPELVRALILARPAWGIHARPVNMAPNMLAGEMIAAGRSLAEFEATPMAQALAEAAPDNLASLRGFFSRLPLAVTAALLRQISADGPGVSEEDLSALTLPVLVIGHARDLVHPLGLAQDLANRIPGAQFVEITPKADDSAAYRRDFLNALSAFLEAL